LIDIKLIRENPELIRKDLRKRKDEKGLKLLGKIVEKDVKQREMIARSGSLRNKRNELSREADRLRQNKKDFSAVAKEAKKLNKEIASCESELDKLKKTVRKELMCLPNLMHETVPVGKDDSENVVIKTAGKPEKPAFKIKHHGQFAASLNIADFERGVKISGSGFYFLRGELALLDMALQRLGIDMLVKKGYTPVLPPLLMRREPYEGVTDLRDFEDVMYKIEDEDLYLIATSEHPVAAMYTGEIFTEPDLPVKIAGISPCFRKEIGRHGLDERGLFRVHQFNKVEQFIFCMPEESWKFHEELRQNAEEFLDALKIPYNVTNICTGDLGTVAAKKYDINGWSPREEKYIELMSCSNCTAYQAARLNIKYRKKNGEKEHIHTLNSTMVATSRTIRVILENCQTEDGKLRIPKVLQSYMGGLKEIGSHKSG
jgi:seryl-tRNA synthetase